MKIWLFGAAFLALAGAAHAQSLGGGHGGGGGDAPTAPAEPKMPDIKPLPPPAQRLEAGALLCDTEEELIQHQRAVSARLTGGFSPEPSGCHILRDMTAVTLLAVHGQAATQVLIKADVARVGWTDSHVRDLK